MVERNVMILEDIMSARRNNWNNGDGDDNSIDHPSREEKNECLGMMVAAVAAERTTTMVAKQQPRRKRTRRRRKISLCSMLLLVILMGRITMTAAFERNIGSHPLADGGADDENAGTTTVVVAKLGRLRHRGNSHPSPPTFLPIRQEAKKKEQDNNNNYYYYSNHGEDGDDKDQLGMLRPFSSKQTRDKQLQRRRRRRQRLLEQKRGQQTDTTTTKRRELDIFMVHEIDDDNDNDIGDLNGKKKDPEEEDDNKKEKFEKEEDAPPPPPPPAEEINDLTRPSRWSPGGGRGEGRPSPSPTITTTRTTRAPARRSPSPTPPSHKYFPPVLTVPTSPSATTATDETPSAPVVEVPTPTPTLSNHPHNQNNDDKNDNHNRPSSIGDSDESTNQNDTDSNNSNADSLDNRNNNNNNNNINDHGDHHHHQHDHTFLLVSMWIAIVFCIAVLCTLCFCCMAAGGTHTGRSRNSNSNNRGTTTTTASNTKYRGWRMTKTNNDKDNNNNKKKNSRARKPKRHVVTNSDNHSILTAEESIIQESLESEFAPQLLAPNEQPQEKAVSTPSSHSIYKNDPMDDELPPPPSVRTTTDRRPREAPPQPAVVSSPPPPSSYYSTTIIPDIPSRPPGKYERAFPEGYTCTDYDDDLNSTEDFLQELDYICQAVSSPPAIQRAHHHSPALVVASTAAAPSSPSTRSTTKRRNDKPAPSSMDSSTLSSSDGHGGVEVLESEFLNALDETVASSSESRRPRANIPSNVVGCEEKKEEEQDHQEHEQNFVAIEPIEETTKTRRLNHPRGRVSEACFTPQRSIGGGKNKGSVDETHRPKNTFEKQRTISNPSKNASNFPVFRKFSGDEEEQVQRRLLGGGGYNKKRNNIAAGGADATRNQRKKQESSVLDRLSIYLRDSNDDDEEDNGSRRSNRIIGSHGGGNRGTPTEESTANDLSLQSTPKRGISSGPVFRRFSESSSNPQERQRNGGLRIYKAHHRLDHDDDSDYDGRKNRPIFRRFSSKDQEASDPRRIWNVVSILGSHSTGDSGQHSQTEDDDQSSRQTQASTDMNVNDKSKRDRGDGKSVEKTPSDDSLSNFMRKVETEHYSSDTGKSNSNVSKRKAPTATASLLLANDQSKKGSATDSSCDSESLYTSPSKEISYQTKKDNPTVSSCDSESIYTSPSKGNSHQTKKDSNTINSCDSESMYTSPSKGISHHTQNDNNTVNSCDSESIYTFTSKAISETLREHEKIVPIEGQRRTLDPTKLLTMPTPKYQTSDSPTKTGSLTQSRSFESYGRYRDTLMASLKKSDVAIRSRSWEGDQGNFNGFVGINRNVGVSSSKAFDIFRRKGSYGDIDNTNDGDEDEDDDMDIELDAYYHDEVDGDKKDDMEEESFVTEPISNVRGRREGSWTTTGGGKRGRAPVARRKQNPNNKNKSSAFHKIQNDNVPNDEFANLPPTAVLL